MQAIVIAEFGPPDVLRWRAVENPALGAGDVLIEVELANVTYVETQIRQGRAPHPSMLPQLPAIPGNGVGGRIAAVGADLSGDLIGRQVLSSTGGTGGYAQLAAVRELLLGDLGEASGGHAERAQAAAASEQSERVTANRPADPVEDDVDAGPAHS